MTPEEFFNDYLRSIGKENENIVYVADQFGDNPGLADELCGLILKGVKTATCASLWEYETDGGIMPRAGLLTVVLDGKGEPRCIIESTEVTIKKFSEVDATFAADEGEGDRSFEYWRGAHVKYFSRTLPKIGREFSEDMPLVCERFKMVWKPSL